MVPMDPACSQSATAGRAAAPPSLPDRRIEIASVGMRAAAAAPALGKFN
jgi:hypothetical protein